MADAPSPQFQIDRILNETTVEHVDALEMGLTSSTDENMHLKHHCFDLKTMELFKKIRFLLKGTDVNSGENES